MTQDTDPTLLDPDDELLPVVYNPPPRRRRDCSAPTTRSR